MKAISLLQPWASLVVKGLKKIETRSWSTPYRGQILIHAGLNKKAGLLFQQELFKRHIEAFEALPFGAIIGEAVLINIYRIEDFGLPGAAMNALTLEERAFGDYTAGRFGWILEEAIEYKKPIPARGHLRLFEVDLNSLG